MRSVFARHRSTSRTSGRRWRTAGLALVIGTALVSVTGGCTQKQLEGRGSSYVIVQNLQGASGADPSTFGNTLSSDVLTVVDESPTVFADPGRVVLTLAMKDPAGAAPTTANFVTFNRYRVTYSRADGRNTPGVDVPHSFDGAFTVTVGDQPVTATFTLVHAHAKTQEPLLPLVSNGTILTNARVTLYGADQVGNDVTVSSNISVTFANWGDPD